MSVGDEPVECPLCMEALEIDDLNFFPCTCGYQICRFCWHRIRTDENGLCPACRKQYPEDPAEFKPLTDDELQTIKKERKQKECQRKQKAAENRKHLANVRVVQKNLVFVVGLSPRLADPEVLKKQEYFGKFGKIHKVVINQSTSYAGSQGPSASAYVTYVRVEDALKAILAVNNVHVDGRTLKTSLGTTKYCSNFLRGSQCMKSDCMYLHELGEEAASFTKEEMQMGKHQEYEQKLIEQFHNSQNVTSNHIVNNKTQNSRKKSSSPSAQQQIGQQHSPPLVDYVVTGNGKAGRTGTPNVQLTPSLSGEGNSSIQDAWPSLHPERLTNGNRSLSSNNLSTRTNTPPAVILSSNRVVGNGRRQRSTSENDPSNQDKTGSDAESLVDSPVSQQEVLTASGEHEPQHLVHEPAPADSPHPAYNRSDSAPAQIQQILNPPQPLFSGSQLMMPIGANRASRALAGFQPHNNSLSFFNNNILAGKPIPVPILQPAQGDVPTSLAATEMTDSMSVTSTTDWSAAFGFKTKEIPDDDLGFDPCAESFKGLADLIEKENGGQWPHHQTQTSALAQEHPAFTSHMPHTLSTQEHPAFASAHMPPQPLPLQELPAFTSHMSSQPQHNLPPGFSISHIQQQQQMHQQFFRPDVNVSRMMDLMPYGPRFPLMHNNFHHNPGELGSASLSHLPSQPSPISSQPEHLNMKDMQDQLRSLLPNINISFGSPPRFQSTQPPPLPPRVQHTQPAGGRLPTEVSWLPGDPAIVSSRSFGEDVPHWLKSIHQLTESEGPVSRNNSRRPFAQHFIDPVSGWPPQTQNPPPGFHAPVRPPATEVQKMAEALQ